MIKASYIFFIGFLLSVSVSAQKGFKEKYVDPTVKWLGEQFGTKEPYRDENGKITAIKAYKR